MYKKHFKCCSGELEWRNQIVPCAVKTVAYSFAVDKVRADAELQALYETRHMSAILKCRAVFEEVLPDGSAWLHLATE